MQTILSFIVFLLLCFAVAGFGTLFKPDVWYAALTKPDWMPPDWLFGPVWTVLYVLIASAGWLVWRTAGWQGATRAFALYALQLLLNGFWSWFFFSLHRPGLAFIDIVALWLAIVGNLFAFYAVRPVAGWLLVPYLVWVSFATALNFAIWRLNAA
jgi:tryptophan-rich sensory protein